MKVNNMNDELLTNVLNNYDELINLIRNNEQLFKSFCNENKDDQIINESI